MGAGPGWRQRNEKWEDSGYVLKIRLRRDFQIDWMWVVKQRVKVKSDPKDSGPPTWKDGAASD